MEKIFLSPLVNIICTEKEIYIYLMMIFIK